jgi:hypothetical protein
MLQLLRSFDPSSLDSHPGWVSKLVRLENTVFGLLRFCSNVCLSQSRSLDKVPVSDFFAARQSRLAMSPSPPGPESLKRECVVGVRAREKMVPRRRENKEVRSMQWLWFAGAAVAAAALLFV